MLYAAGALGEELGIGPRRREKMPQDGGDAPHETALLAMTANRRARSASTWAGDAPWLAAEGSWPEAKALALEHRDRARDGLLRHLASLEQELFFRTADLCHADGDLIFWETTPLDGEIDDEDDAGAGWEAQAIPARRPRGHHTAGRAGNPQVVVGLALTRDGGPGRSGVLPGNPAEVTTLTPRQDDLQGWRLNRGVLVGERGMFSAANRQRLRRALGRYSLAVPMRQVTAVPLDVLPRAGRSRAVAHTLRVKAVSVGEGARRRRHLLGPNPDEAARERAHRQRLWARVRAELAALDTRQADHPKQACALLAARRCGRSLTMAARGRLRINAPNVAAEAKDEGTFVVTTNADTLDAEDVALGYTSLRLIAGGFRQMKTTGLQTRPIDHGRPHRIIAHVKRWVLALLLERAAEIRCQPTWRTIRQTLDPLKGVRSRMPGKTRVQSTQVTSPLAESLHRLGMPLPKKILDVFE